MKKPIRKGFPPRFATVLAALAASGTMQMAVAGPLDFAPYVELDMEHDSNLFRVNEDAANETRSEESDQITRAKLGADASWEISRQELLFEGFIRENRYSDFDELDHTDHDVYAAWLYEFGPIVSGTLDVRRQRELNNFEDLDVREKDFRETTNPRLETFLSISPTLRLRTEAAYLDFEHSLATEQRFNREEKLGGVELQLLGKPGSRVGIGVEYIDGEYPNRQPGDVVPAEYDQTFGFLTADWALSGKSRFRGRAGYTRRDASDSGNGGDNRDFEGATGLLGYEHIFSAKTRLGLDLFNQIYSVDQVDAIYVESTGARLSLAWDYSPKLAIVGELGHRAEEYEAPDGSLSAGREDDRSTVGAQLLYEPIRPLAFIFHISAEERDSSEDDESYEYFRGGVAVRLTLDTEPHDQPLSRRLARR